MVLLQIIILLQFVSLFGSSCSRHTGAEGAKYDRGNNYASKYDNP